MFLVADLPIRSGFYRKCTHWSEKNADVLFFRTYGILKPIIKLWYFYWIRTRIFRLTTVYQSLIMTLRSTGRAYKVRFVNFDFSGFHRLFKNTRRPNSKICSVNRLAYSLSFKIKKKLSWYLGWALQNFRNNFGVS